MSPRRMACLSSVSDDGLYYCDTSGKGVAVTTFVKTVNAYAKGFIKQQRPAIFNELLVTHLMATSKIWYLTI